MSMMQAFIDELEQESAATRTLLERVPAEKFSWKPHEKSFSLGQLAYHVAKTPAEISEAATVDSHDLSEIEPTREPESAEELLSLFDASVADAKKALASISDDSLMGMWRLTAEGEEIMAMPRIGLLRAIMLNHLYHHRGQLTVYLRLLDIPLPSVYGPTADENPFM